MRNARKHTSECARCNKLKERLVNKYCDECAKQHVYHRLKSLSDAKQDRSRKSYLLGKRGHCCEVRKLDSWMGKPIPLDLDHTDGNPDNNSEENLRLIYPNCHAQTDTYKGKGTGNGRYSQRKTMRRSRYADGKSY